MHPTPDKVIDRVRSAAPQLFVGGAVFAATVSPLLPTAWPLLLDYATAVWAGILVVQALRRRLPWQNIATVLAIFALVALGACWLTVRMGAPCGCQPVSLYLLVHLAVLGASREAAGALLHRRPGEPNIGFLRLGLGIFMTGLLLFLVGQGGFAPWPATLPSAGETGNSIPGRPSVASIMIQCVLEPFLALLIATPWLLPKYGKDRTGRTATLYVWIGLFLYAGLGVLGQAQG